MGKRRGHLLKLGLKRPSKKIWVSEGFGIGHYKFRYPTMNPKSEVVHLCESRDGFEQWEELVVPTTLEKLGLQRDLKSGQISRIEFGEKT